MSPYLSAMNRTSLASLLIGILAALTGFWSYSLLRKRQCTDVGGVWDTVLRACQVPAGTDPSAAAPTAMTYVMPIVVGAALAFMLTRVFLALSGRGPRAQR